MTVERRVALYYPMRPGNAQGFLRGIFRFARPAQPWEFCLTFGWDVGRLLEWDPDGVIGHVLSTETVAMIERVTVPVVETAFDFAELNVPRVGLDDRAIGVLAAEHFLDLGFSEFVYLGDAARAYSQRRWEGFEARLRRAGHRPTCAAGGPGSDWPDALPPVTAEDRRWVLGLPRPVAAFAASDALALRLLEVARTAGLRVPEDLAVLGVGDVDLICDLAYPPLSSIRTAAEAAGHEAARLLDRLMAGAPPPATRIEFPPLGIVIRRSTDLLAITDADLAKALRFIRNHAGQAIGVDDVVEAVCLSRSSLERRFRAALGRSPLEEIRRVRVDRARRLLIETDWPMPQLAREAGFRDGRHLSEVFQAHTGDTPTAYRKRFRCV
jgi:LacI family transcriptional regulator